MVRWIHRWVERARNLIFRARWEREAGDEMRFHVEMEAQQRIAAGMDPREAGRTAAADFGGIERYRQQARDSLWTSAGDHLVRDTRYAARTLRRSPGFTLTAVSILTLGIGATTAVFSVFDAVLLAPLPYPEPEQLVQIWAVSPTGVSRPVSGANAAEWPALASSLSSMAAYREGRTVTWTVEGDPELLVIRDVQPSWPEVLRVPPLIGRSFVPEDDAGDGHIVVLSYELWDRGCGRDDGAIGGSIELDGSWYQIVGVMPEGFGFRDANVDAWTPLLTGSVGMEPDDRVTQYVLAVGRLRPGVALEAAQEEMTSVAAGEASAHPEMEGWGVNLVALQAEMTWNVRELLTLLLAGVVVVLFVACANLTNLQLARAVRREREFAVRGALGAGRPRIVRQLLTESLLLAALGGAAALLAAPTFLRIFVAMAPAGVPLIGRAAIDGRTLLVSGGLSLLCALVFGLVPAIRQSGSTSARALRGGRDAGQAGHSRLRAALLVGQVSLAVVLLVGAGLFVRSFAALTSVDLGFDSRELTTLSVALPIGDYPTLDGQTRFFDELLQRAGDVPGVVSVGGSTGAPGTTGLMSFPFIVEGREAEGPSGQEDAEDYRIVTPGYFATLGQPLLRGREFTRGDRSDAPSVTIVNEAFANKLWPSQDPIGLRIATPVAGSVGRWLTVVGVVGDARLEGPDVEPVPRFYTPYAQHDQTWQSWMNVIVRMREGAAPAVVDDAMRAALLDLDPRVPPGRVATVAQLYEFGPRPRAFAMTLAVAFALSALLLSVLGLYGLISYSVAARRKEIGLRLALGADPGGVVRAVVARSLLLAGLGAVIGLAAALAATRAIESMLFGVRATDGATYVGTIVLVLLVAAVAAAVPASRASRINPVESLSAE